MTVTGLNVENISGEDGTTSSGSGGSSSDNNNSTETRETSIIVDSSRFTNYIQLPYFGAQYNILGSRENGTATVTAYNSNATATAKTIGTTKTLIDLPITSSALVVYMHASAVNEGDTAQNDTYINITPTLVNKAELRKTYNNAISEMRQEKMFTMGFDAYQNSILDAAVKLGNPINKNLKVKINTAEMERKTGTVTTSYVRDTAVGADYDGKLGEAINGTSSSTQSFTLGEDVYVKYQDIFGYTLSGYSISDATGVLTTGTPKADANDYFIRNAGSTAMKWKFIYTPNSYPVSYDPNGGSFNGSSSVTNTTAYYQSKYSVGSVDGVVKTPTRTGYTFNGWVCNADNATYSTGDGINWEYTKTVKFTAQWTINSYTVTFKNGGTVLQQGKWEYNTTPTYTGDTPTKAKDVNYEYTFSGWSPEIKPVTGDTVYTAQFTGKAHDYRYEIVDSKKHQRICNDCGYTTVAENHNIKYTKVGNKYIYKCTECGYNYSEEAFLYNVDFPYGGGSLIKTEVRPELSENYFIATIQAPLYKGSKYFAYWEDGETGEKVSTYRTYSFFLTGNRSFVPVYVEPTEYTEARNSAVFSSTVAGVKANDDKSYSLYAEHSVAKTIDGFPKYDPNNRVESINKIILRYGVIYTADSAYITTDDAQAMESVLVCGGANVVDKPAGLSDKTRDLTGVFEVKVETGSEAIWARTYIVDANGVVHYGMPKKLSLTAATTTADDEVITLSSESFGSTDLNDETETPEQPSEPTNKNPLEKLTAIWTKLVEIIKKIISFIINPGVRI